MASNTIEQAIYARLTSSTAIHDHCADRVYFIEAERDAAMPYVTYSVVSDPHMPFALGNKNTGQPRVRVHVWDDDRYVALAVGNHVRDALRWQTSLDGLTVYWAQCSGPVVMRDPNESVYHAIVDALIQYKEST